MNYIATYGNDYSGDVIAQNVTFTKTGGVLSEGTATVAWDAKNFLPPNTSTGYKVYNTRVIATSSAQGTGKGIPFEWANIFTRQKKRRLGLVSHRQRRCSRPTC